MFTIDQIQQAHENVKSGADFPQYIKELKTIGVESYMNYVLDGHSIYTNSIGHSITTPAKYAPLSIHSECDTEQFLLDLKAHQEGKTDYLTFCRDCAKSGIEKWKVDILNNNCIYYDSDENLVLIEQIGI